MNGGPPAQNVSNRHHKQMLAQRRKQRPAQSPASHAKPNTTGKPYAEMPCK